MMPMIPQTPIMPTKPISPTGAMRMLMWVPWFPANYFLQIPMIDNYLLKTRPTNPTTPVKLGKIPTGYGMLHLETASYCADDPSKLFLPSQHLFLPTVAMQSPNQLNRLEMPIATIPRSVAFYRRWLLRWYPRKPSLLRSAQSCSSLLDSLG